MNPYLLFILTVLIVSLLLDIAVELLNLRHISTSLPPEFRGFYDAKHYARSQLYLKENTLFGLVREILMFGILVTAILTGAFNYIDHTALRFGVSSIWTGLIFTAIITLFLFIIGLPFSIYHTFVLEQKFGFNKTKPVTFILDKVKQLLIGGVLGGLVLYLVLWFFTRTGSLAWLWSWMALIVIQVFIIFIAPVVIMPLFNKFTVLKKSPLRTTLEKLAKTLKFKIQGIFVMDGSRRSTKSNAFFTGLGRTKRIVLFDTLVKDHSVNELTGVLAHEIGHYKKGHIMKGLVFSIVSTGVMFYILSLFISSRPLFDAFRMEHMSIYAGLLFFGFLFTPINMFLDIIGNALSRAHEREADRFAAQATRRPADLALALKKLSVKNLSNLTPHPWKVFFDYSHPPVLERIRSLVPRLNNIMLKKTGGRVLRVPAKRRKK